jgi:hypothetical protein
MIHISRERRAFSGLAAAVACAAFLAAACSGASSRPLAGNPQAGPVPEPSSAQASSPGSDPSPAGSGRSAGQPGIHASPRYSVRPTASPPAASPGPSALASCATSALRGSLGATSVAAGTFYYPVQLTNISAADCTLYGYPGVSVVTGPEGAQIGDFATRIATFSAQLVTLAPGATVHATMQTPDPGVLGPSVCVPKTVQWLRVYPPGQFTPLYVSVPATTDPVQICTGHHLDGAIPLGIFVVMTGSTGA